MVLVSVVVPAYNSGRFLAKSIQSVLNQDFQDFEIIVVDDGSTDDTIQRLKNIVDPRLRVIEQPNGGAASARNLGIRASRGRYVSLLDADDEWAPKKLGVQVAVLESRPDVGVVHCGIRYIDERSTEIGRPLGVKGDGFVWNKIVLSGSIYGIRCGSTPMIRRTCFDAVGEFDTSLTFSEEWDMWLRLAGSFKFVGLDQVLVSYRQHGSNMTKSYTRVVPNQQRILDRAFAENSNSSGRLRARAFARSHLFGAWRAYYGGDFALSRQFLWRGLSSDPLLLCRPNCLRLVLCLWRRVSTRV